MEGAKGWDSQPGKVDDWIENGRVDDWTEKWRVLRAGTG